MPDNIVLMVKCFGLILGTALPFGFLVYLFASGRFKSRKADETDMAGAVEGDPNPHREVTK